MLRIHRLLASLCGFAILAASGCATSTAPTFATQATLDEKLEVTRDHLSLPGAVIYVREGDDVLVHRALGVASLETKEPMSLDHRFRLASITKPVVATVLLQLVDEGTLSLDDPVANHLDGVPGGERITLRMLAQHTSGLVNYIALPHVKEAFAQSPERMWTEDELLAFAFAEKPYFKAGKDGWMYSNTNYVLLGQLIERVEGQPLDAVIQRRICEPLGLTATYYSVDAGDQVEPFAHGYQYGDLEGPIYWKGMGDVPYDVTDASPSMWHAAGAMVSTLSDTVTLIEAIVNGELVSPAMHAEQMTWRASGYPVDYDYGLGLIRYFGAIGHNGNTPGYQATAMHDASADRTVVVLTNLYSSPNYEDPANALYFVIHKDITGRSVAPPGWNGW